jgi:4-hydroxythreonine-4-phosphate dehydrogenase
MTSAERPLALTIGDPAGIGPDIALYAWAARTREAIPPFVLIGDPAVLAARALALGLRIPIAELSEAGGAPSQFQHALPVLPITCQSEIVAGRPDRAAAPLITQSIERAVALALQGAARAVVTNLRSPNPCSTAPVFLFRDTRNISQLLPRPKDNRRFTRS